MSALSRHLQQHGIDPRHAMNALQAAGVVSDNAVHAEDVATVDAALAITWLMENKQKVESK